MTENQRLYHLAHHEDGWVNWMRCADPDCPFELYLGKLRPQDLVPHFERHWEHHPEAAN